MADFPEIPGYEIKSKLGEGGMATVYLAIQENLKREVAIKILEPFLLKDEKTARRFKREAETAAGLSHTNIITIHTVGQIDKCHYIVMEYLKESLRDRMNRNPEGKIEPETALDIAEKILVALDYAHSKKVFHRDIKPENIMFRPDGTPVLVDFGIARILNAPSDLTKSGQNFGTVYYMSPEQAKAKKKLDGRIDIYSLGVTIYEMLTGKKPYKQDSFVSVALMHIQEPVPKLPGELSLYQPLIDNMMNKDRDKRIKNRKEFIKLLHEIGIKTNITILQPVESPPSSQEPKTKVTSAGLILKKTGGTIKTVFNGFIRQKKSHLLLYFLALLAVVSVIIIIQPGPSPIQKQVSTLNEKKETAEMNRQPSSAELEKEKQFREKLKLVLQYLEKEDYEKAEALAEELKEIKNTQEIKDLVKKINQLKEKKFDQYLTNAAVHLNREDFPKARENLLQARQIKTTPQLKALEKSIDNAQKLWEERMREKDDKAFRQATNKNTIKAYRKYLKAYPQGRHSKKAARYCNVLIDRKRLNVNLRSQYQTISDDDVKPMLKKNKFFEKKLNAKGTFKSYCEQAKQKGQAVVIDHTTGLMWYNGIPSGEKTFDEAEKWIEELNKKKHGGYEDWRLPTLEEAASLLRKRKNWKKLHIDPKFSNNQPKIWTKDPHKRVVLGIIGGKKYWVVFFDSGTVKSSSKSKENKFHVRPVRSMRLLNKAKPDDKKQKQESKPVKSPK